MSGEEDTATVVDFESGKQEHLHKRKEAKVEALKRAFREARADKAPDKTSKNRIKRSKRRKSSKK